MKCLVITAPYRSKSDVLIKVCAVYFLSCYSLILRLFSVKHSGFLVMFSFFSHLLPLFAVQRQQGYASLQDEAVRVFNSLQEMETLADTVPIIQGILQTCQDLRPLRDEVVHHFNFNFRGMPFLFECINGRNDATAKIYMSILFFSFFPGLLSGDKTDQSRASA